MKQFLIVASAAALLLSASGETTTTEPAAVGTSSPPPPPTPMTTAPTVTLEAPVEVECDQAVKGSYRLCMRIKYGEWSRATIERKTSGDWKMLAGEPKGAVFQGMANGRWSDLWLSPDGKTLLAQWQGECENPTAFFLSVNGGPLRVVTGEARWEKGAESTAIGWLDDGRAQVRLGEGACGNAADEPGVYAIDPGTFTAEFLSSR